MSQIHITSCEVASFVRRSRRRALLTATVLLGTNVFANETTMAGCNSGDAADQSLLNSASCQGHANDGGTAVGQSATAGLAGTAFGQFANANTRAATAVGFAAGFPQTGFTISVGATMVGASAGSEGAGFNSTAVGSGASAAGAYSIAVGGTGDVSGELPAAHAQGLRSIAIGHNALSVDFGTSVGFKSTTAFASTAIGTDTNASGDSSSALGRFSNATGPQATALGSFAEAGGGQSTALGYNTKATGSTGTALGGSAKAGGISSTAVGVSSTAMGQFSTALGRLSNASASGSLALASNSRAVASNSIAIGANAAAGGDGTAYNSVAIGSGAKASANRAVAIGYNSIGDAVNTVSVGAVNQERRIVHVAPAVTPTDAVNLAQVKSLIAAASAAPVATAAVSQIPGRFASKSQNHASSRSAAFVGGGAPIDARLASRGEQGNDARSVAPGAVASISCELSGAKVSTTAAPQNTGASAFGVIQHSGISFEQAAPGCVTLSFTAEVDAPGESIMEVRAVLNGAVDAAPGPVCFSPREGVACARSFTFVFPNVDAGLHRIELQFRNAGKSGSVRVGLRTSMLQFAR